jgi:hypothetical protein
MHRPPMRFSAEIGWPDGPILAGVVPFEKSPGKRDRQTGLFAVQRAVNVAGIAERLAAETQDRRVVDQTIRDGDRLGG